MVEWVRVLHIQIIFNILFKRFLNGPEHVNFLHEDLRILQYLNVNAWLVDRFLVQSVKFI